MSSSFTCWRPQIYCSKKVRLNKLSGQRTPFLWFFIIKMLLEHTHVNTYTMIKACWQAWTLSWPAWTKLSLASTKKVELVSMKKVQLTSMNKVELTSMNKVELTSMNKVELVSMNKVELTSINNAVLANINKVELASMNNVVNNVAQSW